VTPRREQADSFEAMAMPMFDSLYNFAHWLTRNRQDAEDLVQETYLKALKGFGSFQTGSNFRAWIYRILRNTFLTSRSGLEARMTEPFEDEPALERKAVACETPESVLLARADQRAIEGALAELPVIYREVILLSDMEEMSYREIADTIGIPAGTVMSRLSRARKAMRELIGHPRAGALQ
jgi:RNA polymerase sigma-70 factor, ECF subfamily